MYLCNFHFFHDDLNIFYTIRFQDGLYLWGYRLCWNVAFLILTEIIYQLIFL